MIPLITLDAAQPPSAPCVSTFMAESDLSRPFIMAVAGDGCLAPTDRQGSGPERTPVGDGIRRQGRGARPVAGQAPLLWPCHAAADPGRGVVRRLCPTAAHRFAAAGGRACGPGGR